MAKLSRRDIESMLQEKLDEDVLFAKQRAEMLQDLFDHYGAFLSREKLTELFNKNFPADLKEIQKYPDRLKAHLESIKNKE